MPVDSFNPYSRRAATFQSGFGLVELIVTIAIVAVLAALALPSYQQTIKNNRTITEAGDLLTALDTARTEAVTRSRFVSVCPSDSTGTQCVDGTDWSTGWLVYADDYANGIGTFVAGTDTVLRVWPPSNALQRALDTIVASQGGAAISWVSFDRQGVPRTSAGLPTAATQTTFVIQPSSCPTGSQLVRTVTIATLGRTSSVTSACP